MQCPEVFVGYEAVIAMQLQGWTGAEIGVGIGVAVLVGTCAAALSSGASPRASKNRT